MLINTNFKKILLTYICIFLALIVLIIGTLAYFTDATSANAAGRMGSLQIVLSDITITNSEILNPGDGDLSLEGKDVAGYSLGTAASGIMNTLTHELIYKIENIGNKSAYTRHTILISISKNGKNLDPTYLSIHDGRKELGSKSYIMQNGEEYNDLSKIASKKDIKYIKYAFESDLLNGKVNSLFTDEFETEENGKSGEQTYSRILAIDHSMNNDYQSAYLSIDVVAEAMQYRNNPDKIWSSLSRINNIIGEDYEIITVPDYSQDKDGNTY